MISRYLFDIAYYWVTKEISPHEEIDYDDLKKKIEENFHSLPEPLTNSSTNVTQDQEKVILEALGGLEYSSPFRTFLYNKGTWVFSIFRTIMILVGVVLFVIGQIKLREYENQNAGLLFILISIVLFILARVFRNLSSKIFKSLLKNLKPGDYLKLSQAKDEQILFEKKKNPFGPETSFNKMDVLQSKKQVIAENIISSRFSMPQNLSTYFVVFLAVSDVLKKVGGPNAYEEYLLEIKKEVLMKIIEENVNNVAICHELMIIHLYQGDFEKAYDVLAKCRKQNPYDYLIEQFYQTLDFCFKYSNSEIREANIKDAPVLAKLCNELGYETTEDEVEARLEKRFGLEREHSKIFVAEMGGQVVAFVSFDAYELIYAPSALNITGLVVTERFRRQGIAKLLLEKVENYGRENGFSLVRINSGKERIDAHEFYRHMNYDSEKDQIRFLKEL